MARLLFVCGAAAGAVSPGVASLPSARVPASVSRAMTGANAPVSSKLSAWKVVEAADGAEKLVEASKVAPGDVIEYRVEYRNAGGKAVRDLVATLPIPAAMSYIEKTARPAKAQGSANGRAFGPLPLRRRVKNADGSTNVVAVPASQYRYLRWNVASLAPGQSISFAARAKVNRQ